LGNFSSRLCSSRGVVITKMINNTNARSSNGVILISLNVTSELRWEKRRIWLVGAQGDKFQRREPQVTGRGSLSTFDSGHSTDLSMNPPPHPALSPSEGERVPAGRVRGRFMVPMRVQSWRSRLSMNLVGRHSVEP